MVIPDKLLRICGNCFDFDREKKLCTIRYTILPDKTKIPMKRKAVDKGCAAFMYA